MGNNKEKAITKMSMKMMSFPLIWKEKYRMILIVFLY